MKNNNITITAELFNLLTLIYDDNIDEYSREDIIELIDKAAKSVGV